MPDRTAQRLDDHIQEADKCFTRLEGKIDNQGKDLATVKDNHLAHMQESIGEMQVDVANVTNDVNWLKRFFWIIATASVGALVTGIMNLFVTYH